MCSRFSMPDPRLITDFTPMCMKEETLKARLRAHSDQEYRRMLQDRAIDIIRNEEQELQGRAASFKESLQTPSGWPQWPGSFPDKSDV
jgi:hypothetical protein